MWAGIFPGVLILGLLLILAILASIFCEHKGDRVFCCCWTMLVAIFIAIAIGEIIEDYSWKEHLVRDHKIQYVADSQTGKTTLHLIDTTLQETFKLTK